jgi:Rps23 Pro-64 3,4-dihydroxylase Tpa1-like proline 4-hydroxylase
MAGRTAVTVIDDWGPVGLVRAADAEWPRPDWPHWHSYDDAHARKYGTMDSSRVPAAAAALIGRMAAIDLQSHGFEVEAFPDLHLHGAGLHMLPPGGFLQTHLDGAVHPLRGWRREVNAVLFVSPWDAAWGGRLRFDTAAGDVLEAIEPRFNRLVLFATGDSAYHGVDPVTGPEERRTLSLFWWSRQPAESTRERAKFV